MVNNERDTEYLKALGANLRALRKAKGFTQEQLEVGAGLSEHLISKIERGLVSVSAVTVKRIATTLGVHPKDIFDF